MKRPLFNCEQRAAMRYGTLSGDFDKLEIAKAQFIREVRRSKGFLWALWAKYQRLRTAAKPFVLDAEEFEGIRIDNIADDVQVFFEANTDPYTPTNIGGDATIKDFRELAEAVTDNPGGYDETV